MNFQKVAATRRTGFLVCACDAADDCSLAALADFAGEVQAFLAFLTSLHCALTWHAPFYVRTLLALSTIDVIAILTLQAAGKSTIGTTCPAIRTDSALSLFKISLWNTAQTVLSIEAVSAQVTVELFTIVADDFIICKECVFARLLFERVPANNHRCSSKNSADESNLNQVFSPVV